MRLESCDQSDRRRWNRCRMRFSEKVKTKQSTKITQTKP